jgi:cytoskeleton protein RodZ
MSEIEAPRQETQADAAPLPGFGRRLAAERARLGLSVNEIAARLRLHPKQVQAIENEALPALPAPFLRGFVRNYAKELRLDPAPLVAELNARLGPQAGELQRFATGGSGSGGTAPSGHGSRRVVVTGVLVVLVGLALVGGLATRSEKRRAEAASESKPVLPAPPPPAVVEQKVEPAPPPPTEAAAPVAAPLLPTPPAAADSVHLSFREQSRVEVTQADGRIVHSQVNEPGTEQRIEGKPPLRVVIGNASAVSLDYKGKAFDLKAVTGADNVARITLN